MAEERSSYLVQGLGLVADEVPAWGRNDSIIRTIEAATESISWLRWAVITMLWLLSLVQVWWPLLNSIEAWWKTIKEQKEYESSLRCTKLYVEDVAYDLAEASGMVAVQKLQLMDSAAGVGEAEGIEAQESYAVGFSNSVATRIVLSWLGENAVHQNVQTSLFALAKGASKGRDSMPKAAEIQALISIVVSLLAVLFKLVEAWEFFKLILPIRQASSRKVLGVNVWVARIGCSVLVLTLGFAIAKVIAAYVCDDALLNFTGCAVIDVQLPDQSD